MNGVGPAWAPEWLRAIFTWFSAMFFDEAGWREHDQGYQLATTPRWLCDLRFLQAMVRDASHQHRAIKIAACCALALTFWAMVRLFGWASYGRGAR